MKLHDNVSVLKDVGDARQKKLASLGIFTIHDLLCYYPKTYEDRSIISPIEELCPGQIATIRACVSETKLSFAKGMKLVKARLRDESGDLTAVWFNQPYLKNSFRPEIEYAFTGMISERLGRLQMTSPSFEAAGSGKSANFGRIIPVYSLTSGITQKLIRKLIEAALGELNDAFPELLSSELIAIKRLCGRPFAIKNIHFPESNEAFYIARKRLVFEELLVFSLALSMLKKSIKKKSDIIFTDLNYNKLISDLPFHLTNAQKNTMGEIVSDFESGLVSARLVQGDVGSGKTIIAAIAAYITVKNGYQAVLMAPTEVLAKQHFLYFAELFGESFNIVFLSGSVSAQEKKAAYESITSGEANIIIGTHALIEDKVKFKNLGLAITDEQHRFGVMQRKKLGEMHRPHILVMTATPIPRTLALVLYGDMDVSVINELPPGRQHIDTFVVNSSMRKRVYSFIEKELVSGRQAYIICPTIEESEMSELNSAKTIFASVSNAFPSYPCRLMHGKMKADEKDDVMSAFSVGAVKILVSTTVIEVGVNVPNSTIMLVENAERFGLSQLDQLRGRVGRGIHKSYCVLISDSKTKKTTERLNVMAETNDGFKIAELDLKLRGAGDIFGLRQSGLAEFRIANIYEDIELFSEVQRTVKEILVINQGLQTEIDMFLENHAKISL